MRAVAAKLLLTLAALSFVGSVFGQPAANDATFATAVAAMQKQDYAKALSLWQKLADNGDSHAQFNLFLMYDTGLGVQRDDTVAAKWLRKAADQGLAEAELDLGAAYYRGLGVPGSATEAARWYRKAASQGLAEAQFNLGTLYLNGEGVPRDDAKALYWLGK